MPGAGWEREGLGEKVQHAPFLRGRMKEER